MDQLEQEIQRAQHAKDLLDNPLYKDTWKAYEQEILQQLKTCSPRDAEGLQKAVMLLQIMAKFQHMVQQTVETGKLAQMQVQRKTLRQVAAEWIGRDGLAA